MRTMSAQIKKTDGVSLRTSKLLYEIMPNLYLATFHEAQQALKNVSAGQVFVVNCTCDFPMLSERGIRIAVNDDGTNESLQRMVQELKTATQKIREEMESGSMVVVHCLAGQQRSPTVIAAYLMRYYGFNVDKAIQYVREKKRDAFFWRVNFRESLDQFAMDLGEIIQ